MKNTVFKGKIKKSKKFIRGATFLLIIILTIAAVFPITISANSEIRVENYNNCEKYLQQLRKEINTYASLDQDPNKTVSQAVAKAIDKFQSEIVALQTHQDIEERSLENEILLSYQKGVASGHLAWIYHYSVYAFSNEVSVERITSKYESCTSVIESATQHSTLSTEYKTLAADLNTTIYSERVQNLSLPTDTLAAKAFITGALEEIKTANDSSIHAEKLENLYKALTTALSLQRARDSLLASVKEAFMYICPQENISNSSDFALFAYNLEKSSSIKEMNSAALTCITAFIASDPTKPYSSSIKAEYINAAANAASKATEDSKAATFDGIFEGYPLSAKKSMVKDSIHALFLGDGSSSDAKLKELESEFNSKGGRIDACSSISATETEFTNAKAQLFLHKHSAIYEKPLSAITHEDEIPAKNALIAYTELEKETKSLLLAEINIIAEKYNIALSKKILSLMDDDALYQDLCEDIIKELKLIPRDDIDVFYNRISKIPQKAYALSDAVKEYREILASDHYKDFTDIETAELSKALNDFSTALSAISPSDFGTYSDEIDDAKALAIRALNITSQCARVRIAAADSTNPSVAEELATGYEKIKICTVKGEMITQANRAIFKIQRHLTSDEILKRIELAKEELNSFEFLNEDEAKVLLNDLETLNLFAEDAKLAESATALETLWSKFLKGCETALSKAAAIDLTRAIAVYLEKIPIDAENTSNAIKNLEFISKEKSDEICNNITTLKEESSKSISNCKSTKEVLDAYKSWTTDLDNTLDSANKADLEGYKLHLLSEFDKYESIKANYSAENYNKIAEIQNKAKEDIKALTTKEACKNLIDSALSEISKINDLLDDEKEKAIASLQATLTQHKNDSLLYSEENLTKIEALCNEATNRIQAINDIANISSVNETLLQYLASIKTINKDFIYTSKDAYEILTTPTLQYPSDYQTTEGLWGSINSPDSLFSDAIFNINEINVSNIDDIIEKIQDAAKKDSLISSIPLSRETLKLLSSSKIVMSLNMSLSKEKEGVKGYTVKLLLPQNLLSENVLGIAVVNADGSVEFFNVEKTNSILSFKLDNLSQCYVIAEGTINVKPLLIFLIFLLIAEFIILITIIYLKVKKNKGDNNSPMSNLPVAAFVPPSFALTKILPQNGIILSVFLSIAAIALGATIILLVKKDANRQNKNNRQSLLRSSRKELLENKKAKFYLPEPSNIEITEEKVFCTVGASSNNAQKCYTAEIDLDMIAENFDSGETVNMQTLKYKGLVDKDAKYVKILAKGTLTKPLRVEANEFSTTARKILEISGGEAKEIK